jgi:hypothetical protein
MFFGEASTLYLEAPSNSEQTHAVGTNVPQLVFSRKPSFGAAPERQAASFDTPPVTSSSTC